MPNIREEIIYSEGYPLSALIAEPKGPSRGIVQIIHGSLEYKEKYLRLIDHLQGRGYTVIICDMRGHGKSTDRDYPEGYMRSVKEVVYDQRRISEYIREIHPDLPLVLIGHSLGSMVLRLYLAEADEHLAGAVMTGTASARHGASIAALLTCIVAPFTGGMKHGRARFLNRLAGLDRPVEEWLCNSQNGLERHRRDRAVCPMFLNGGFRVLFSIDARMGKRRIYKVRNPDLPILSMTGSDDPVAGGEKGLRKSLDLLTSVGYRDLRSVVFPGLKHEIFSEDDCTEVYRELDGFIADAVERSLARD